VVFGGHACSAAVSEQASVSPVHQRQTGRAGDDAALGRSDQVGG
jgi:hypothetical protein